MPTHARERLSRRLERAQRLQDLADTLEESAGDHDPQTAQLLRHQADQLVAQAAQLVPESYSPSTSSWDQLEL